MLIKVFHLYEIYITLDEITTIRYEIDKEDIYLHILYLYIVISKVKWHGS